jgi:XRE family transcriptional regulator, regulator of sulfur utilization
VSDEQRRLDIGARLKKVRTDRGLSLRALGEQIGFSAAFLSQVELGQASPSLASLGKIVAALDLTLAQFLSEPPAPSGPTIRRRDEDAMHSEWSKATLQAPLPAGTHPFVGVLVIGLEPGGKSGKSPVPDVGHVFAYCVRGVITLVLDDREVKLTEGDSVFFDSAKPAQWKNDGDARSEILLVTMRGP